MGRSRRRRRVFSAMPRRERLEKQAALAERKKQKEQQQLNNNKKKDAELSSSSSPRSPSYDAATDVELMLDVPFIDHRFTDSPEFVAWLMSMTMREGDND